MNKLVSASLFFGYLVTMFLWLVGIEPPAVRKRREPEPVLSPATDLARRMEAFQAEKARKKRERDDRHLPPPEHIPTWEQCRDTANMDGEE